MPAKGRRVASRQAQLGRKRRRQTRGPGATPLDGPSAAVVDRQPVDAEAAPAKRPVTPASGERVAAPSRPPPARPQRGTVRARGDRSMPYEYVGTELRRILILSGALIVVLIVISFFL